MSAASQGTRGALLTGLVCVSVVSFWVLHLDAAGTPQELYLAALGRERTVRAALLDERAPLSVHADVRAVVAAYQEIVRLYPRSGYSDNALWQAGVLSLDAFTVFGRQRDKTTAVRLLRLLTTEYPTSRQVREVPAQLARVDPQSAIGADPLQTAGKPTKPANADTPSSKVGLATIRDIRREVFADAVRITIELDREVPFHDERIQGPVRVFLDLPSTRTVAALVDKTIRFDDNSDLVRQIRIGRHPNNLTRVVLDAADAFNYSVYALYEPYRLVIDCVREPKSAGPPQKPTATGDVLRTVSRSMVPANVPEPTPLALTPPPPRPRTLCRPPSRRQPHHETSVAPTRWRDSSASASRGS